MNKNILLLLSGLLMALTACHPKKTELTLLGTVHQPVENFNSDSLYDILVKIEPDLILFEVDSSFFTPEFKFIKTWDSNENIASIKYMNNFEVDLRPYDFTGRNEYRIKIGSRPTDSKASQLLDSLYNNNALTPADNKIYEQFMAINDSLNAYAYLGAKAFNNPKTDSTAQIRQAFQYQELLSIMAQYPIFSNTYHHITKHDSISYYDGYQRAGEFWDLRNHAMASHILHFVNAYRGSRIVVLNGYFHRYYLNALLQPEQKQNDFVIKHFSEY